MTLDIGLWAGVLLVLACLVAGLAHGALGFGFPMIATPLFALVLDVKTAIGLLGPVTLLLVTATVLHGRRGTLEVARQFWFLPAVLVAGAWLGTRILLAAPPEPFLLLLAVVIFLYLNLDRLGRGRSARVQRHPALFGVGFGFVAGLFESAANVAGPMLLIYFMLLGVAPVPMVQALNLSFFLGKGTQVAAWVPAGAMTSAGWTVAALLSVPSLAALAVGLKIRSRIDAATYRAWVRKALAVIVVLLLGQFLLASQALASDEQLFAAIDDNKELAAEGLVARGRASVNARNAQRETPLHRAVEKGMRGLAQLLVKSGADLKARAQNGETVLHLAALHVDPFFVDLLLKAGADLRVRNDDGETPLMWAALSGHLVTVQRLLNDGADANVPDIRGNLPLHAAADGGHPELVRILLPRTRDPAARNRAGRTALELARERGHDDVEKLLE